MLNVKANIRQRRQERIRTLQRYSTGTVISAEHRNPGPEIHRLAANQDQEMEQLDNQSGKWEEKMQDPEFVWRLKEKQLFAASSGPGSSYPPLASASLDPFENERPPSPILRRFILRCLLSGAAFLMLLGVFQLNHPAADPVRLWVERALTEEINFAPVAAWYESKFGGSPAFLPAFRGKKGQETEKVHSAGIGHFAVPVRGDVVKAFSVNSPWLEVKTSEDAPVLSMASGRVTFSGYLEETGYTLVIEHAGGLSSVYGYLKENRWQANDWIESGEIIGHTQPMSAKWANTLYFAVKTEDDVLDPAEVVAFD
ncbi:M23 family metallopeptidase [Paenibacillus senegalensis]|uniref:M23 family metallopeptidase n=1 Tax=Paenibacillus senegalensis TaxID=1465766 RepID=UPI0002895852|nr:M23 family metallopeptidase [Paenibacillus senegalensis]